MDNEERYCPNCGAKVPEGSVFCPECGHRLYSQGDQMTGERRRGFAEHLNIGINVALSHPMVFVPVILSGIISGALDFYSNEPYAFFGLLSLIGAFISFLLNFASIDMSRDAYFNEPLDLGSSINYVLGRFLTFFLASIVGALMSITIILIPVALFMFVVMVMDESGISYSISRSFNVLRADLGDIILIILVSIIGSAILGFIPLIGGLLLAGLNVIIGLSFIDIYSNYKQTRQSNF
jgi:uncharacterized paraquat-inducible protein A